MRRLQAGVEAASVVLDAEKSASYYPDEPKKSRVRIALELFKNAFLTGEGDEEYFLYGRDTRRVGSRSFPTRGALMNVVYRQVQEGGRAQSALLNDKLKFAAFLEGRDFPTPPIFGLTENGSIVSRTGDRIEPDDALRSAGGRLFLKPVNGSAGRGTYRIVSKNGELTANEVSISAAELPGIFGSGLLVQPVVSQHPQIASLHASSLNTVRIVTALIDGQANVLASFLRLGTGGAPTDNFSGSGIAVAIDRESGMLLSPGFYRDASRGRPAAHPDSGISFDAFEVPYYHVACELCCEIHEGLGGLATVGWDVALTPDGPTIMEGNVYWMPRMHIASDPTFLPRYASIVAPWLRERDMVWARTQS